MSNVLLSHPLMSFLSVDAELSAVGDAGAGVDEDVLDAVFE